MADKEKIVATEESKPKKPVKEKKKGRLKEAWRGFKSESKKVVWPSWRQVLKNSGVVIAIIAICALMIGALDLTFRAGLEALTKLFTA